MTKSIDQHLFDALYKLSDKLGYDTHPVLPQEEVDYPFVVIGEIQFLPRYSTYRLYGKAFATIDVWGTEGQRKKVAEICEKIMLSSGYLVVGDRKVSLDLNASNQRILTDNSTATTLWHGVLNLEFNLI